MNGKTKECRTDLSKEFLDAAVGQRSNLGPHKILYELLHVDIHNQRERRRLTGRSRRCIGCYGLPIARHGGEGHSAMRRSRNMVGARTKGVVVGLPVTVVA